MSTDINWDTLGRIDWNRYSSNEEWGALLDSLLKLAASAGDSEQRNQLAGVLDAFADQSNGPDLTTITKLAKAASQAARGLRLDDMAQSVAALQDANAIYQEVAQGLAGATGGMQQEASRLRGEKVTASITALTGSITSLTALAQAVQGENNPALGSAIAEALASAEKLRTLLNV
jgi:hypothetical protein